jgi:hypothetical protein
MERKGSYETKSIPAGIYTINISAPGTNTNRKGGNSKSKDKTLRWILYFSLPKLQPGYCRHFVQLHQYNTGQLFPEK